MTIIMGYLRVEQRLKLWSYIMRLAPALVKRLSRSRVQGSNPVKLLTFGEKTLAEKAKRKGNNERRRTLKDF